MPARITLSLASLFVLVLFAAAADEVKERDETTLREAKLKVDGPSLIDFFKQRSPTPQQEKEIGETIKELASDSFPARRKAAAKLESFGLPAIGLLKRSLESGDPEIARQCELVLKKIEKIPTEVVAASVARMLGRLKPEGALDTVLTQLPAADDEQVADALRWALAQVAVKDGKPEPKVVAALTDKEPSRRGGAGEALVKAKAAGADAEVRKLLKDEDAAVRLRVALALVTVARTKDAVPELIASLAAAPVSRVWQADEVLRHLAGDDAPKVSPFGKDDERAKARDAWAEWWKTNAAKIDLAKLDTAPQTLGYTLFVQMNQNTGEGEVKEVAPDGRTIRWRVRNLQQPIDAQVIPSQNRVLVAEHNGIVTERDFEGKIQRRWQVSEPVSCQRLADGNTFIATREGLFEYGAKEDKPVFTHNRNQSDIVAGQKDRDGTYVFVTRTGVCTRINAQGKTLKTFNIDKPYYYAGMELLPNNRVLVTHTTGVGEYDLATGKKEWSATVNRNATSATRLPNGNTLVTSMSAKVVEIDRQGKVVKDTTANDGSMVWRVRRR